MHQTKGGWAAGVVLALGLMLVSCSSASANIVFTGGGWSIAMPSWAVPSSGAAVTRDSSDPDVLALEIAKVFRGGPGQFGEMPSIVITFTQIAPDALSRIIINDESVSNLTSVAWTGYDMTLMTDDVPTAAFNHQLTFPGDFPAGDPNQNFYTDQFATRAWVVEAPDTQTLRLSDGIVPVLDDFAPGSLRGSLVIDTIPAVNASVGSPGISFKLKQIARIPEPATLVLLGSGAVLLLRRRRLAA